MCSACAGVALFSLGPIEPKSRLAMGLWTIFWVGLMPTSSFILAARAVLVTLTEFNVHVFIPASPHTPVLPHGDRECDAPFGPLLRWTPDKGEPNTTSWMRENREPLHDKNGVTQHMNVLLDYPAMDDLVGVDYNKENVNYLAEGVYENILVERRNMPSCYIDFDGAGGWDRDLVDLSDGNEKGDEGRAVYEKLDGDFRNLSEVHILEGEDLWKHKDNLLDYTFASPDQDEATMEEGDEIGLVQKQWEDRDGRRDRKRSRSRDNNKRDRRQDSRPRGEPSSSSRGGRSLPFVPAPPWTHGHWCIQYSESRVRLPARPSRTSAEPVTVEDDTDRRGGGDDEVQYVPPPEPAASLLKTRSDPPWPRATAVDQTASSLHYLRLWRRLLGNAATPEEWKGEVRVLSNEVHRHILDGLLTLSDSDLLEAMNGLYRVLALMMAEIVNTVERARHVRDHRGGDDAAMLLDAPGKRAPKSCLFMKRCLLWCRPRSMCSTSRPGE